MLLRAKLTIRNEAMLAARERFGLTQKQAAELAEIPLDVYTGLESLRYDNHSIQQYAALVAGALELTVEQVLPPDAAGKVYASKHFRRFEAEPHTLLEQHPVQLTMTNDPELKEEVEQALSRLLPREREVVRLRYGLGGNSDHSLEQVGRKLNVTRERVRQIEAKAINKLRENQKLIRESQHAT